jgi:hypothetical protein
MLKRERDWQIYIVRFPFKAMPIAPDLLQPVLYMVRPVTSALPLIGQWLLLPIAQPCNAIILTVHHNVLPSSSSSSSAEQELREDGDDGRRRRRGKQVEAG